MVLSKIKKSILSILIISTTLSFIGCENTDSTNGEDGPNSSNIQEEVTVENTDKSELEIVISQAWELYNNAQEGSELNQYKSGAKSELMSMINECEMIYSDDSAKQSEIDSAVSSLYSSIDTFDQNKITQSDRDTEDEITQSDRDEEGYYTREYVEAYVRNQMQDFLSVEGASISVVGDIEDVYYNNELCYMVSSFSPTAGGFGRSEQWYIGAKTLQEYSYSDVTGW